MLKRAFRLQSSHNLVSALGSQRQTPVAMEAPSVHNLCKQLISLAVQRCRLSADLCRLSVAIRRSQPSDPHLIQISISDTGTGSTLEEFCDLKYSFNGVSDGVISVITTCSSDDEIYNYKLNLNETSPSRRIVKLPSTSKNNAKFSGTEVSLSWAENMAVFVTDLTRFFQKMLVLKPQNIAAELMAEKVDHPGSQQQIIVMPNDNMPLPLTLSSNIEHFTTRFEAYVHKHGFYSSEKCHSCIPNRNYLKIGKGVAFTENRMENQMIVDAVIIVSESSETSNCTCFRAQNNITEVLYFKDYSPSSVHPLVLNSLKSINWDAYGLTLGNITTHDGYATLEWQNLPLNAHIDFAVHCYNNQPAVPQLNKKARVEGKLIKTAVNKSLNDLKENHAGYLLSAHALKICDYAPDLARSIAGLILSSEDYDFQGKCLSLLGLEMGSNGLECVENCIKDKITSAIEMNDRKTSRSHDPTPSLFEAYSDLQEQNYMDADYEEGEEGFSVMEG